MKSKYNTGVPIDINELTDAERKRAFHEWAEGSAALEQLLNDGYERGFLSHACCGGDTGHPYISYDLNDEYSRKMAMCVAEQLVNSNLDCQVAIYDNFLLNEMDPTQYPTRDIISLNVQTKMENRDEVFGVMSKCIKEAILDKVQLPESEEQIPSKQFGQVLEDKLAQNDNFINEMQSKVYTPYEIVKKDLKSTKENMVEKHIQKDSEKTI